MVKNNPQMVQTVLDSIKSAKAKIKDKFLSPNTNRTGLKTTYAQLDKFEQMYSDGLREAMGNTSNVQSGEVRQSPIESDFESVYDDWVNRNRPNREVITVGSTSNALKSINVKEQKITWDTSKLNKTLNKHAYLNDAIMKQVPYLLGNPIIVMQSKGFDSRLTMFGEVYDKDGLPIMAVIELLPTNREGTITLDEIKIVSTHSRKSKTNSTSMTQTQDMINTSDILYVEPNKNRTDAWLIANRLQLPLAITEYDPIKSVSYPDENVNTSGRNSYTDNVQIKSATDNIGTFDKNNPDIRYSIKESTGNTVDTETDESGKVSQLYENTMQKDAYTDEFKSEADRRKPEFMYEGITNKETYETAQAKINTGADGDIFELVENSKYDKSEPEKGKKMEKFIKIQTIGTTL